MSPWVPLQWNGDLLHFWWPSTSWNSGHLLLCHWLWTEWCYDEELCGCQWMEYNSTCLQSLVQRTHVLWIPCIYAAVNCGALPNPTSGQVSTPSGTTFMRTATYTCNPGYTLLGGSMTRTCQANVLWSGAAPTCDGQLKYRIAGNFRMFENFVYFVL